MAFINVLFKSQALKRNVPIVVVLPADVPGAEQKKPFKTLYLLHGIFGSNMSWITGSRIQRWAEERNLAVVMPSGENSFYVDSEVTNDKFGEFTGVELVEMTRRMFNLSDKREDTYIGGFSMGGFGALRNGLKYYETFGAIIGLSSAAHLFQEELPSSVFGSKVLGMFGDLKEAAKSDKNPDVLLDQLVATAPKELWPRVYLSCGTEDGLITSNRIFRDRLQAAGFDLHYEEGPGKHDWDFWDPQILKALEWLPLDKPQSL